MLVQARAYSLIGDAYMELDDYDEAADYYTKAAEYKPNEHFTPTYLFKAAIALESADKLEDAVDCYEEIIKKYLNSPEFTDARKHKARLEGLLAG